MADTAPPQDAANTSEPAHTKHTVDSEEGGMFHSDRPSAGEIAQQLDRGTVFGAGGAWLALWSMRLILIAAGAWVLGWIVAEAWVILLPIALALVVCTVLWPPTEKMLGWGLRPALAAFITLIIAFGLFAGLIALIAPSVVNQSEELAQKTTEGIQTVQDWLQGPPLNIGDEQLNTGVQVIVDKLQSSAEAIATGVFSGVSAATSAIITLALAVVLTFFFLKDGPRFLPWVHRVTGTRNSHHIEQVLRRMWATLGGFIRTQALVSFVDAVLIGGGLLILGVPLALPLAVLTFLGGFVPIVGAFVAGAIAVLIALVANGLSTALIVLALILVVQQLEGNVLQPMLQSRSMDLHPVLILLAVTAGGSIFGIIGAFLAVPVAAVVAVLFRYIGEVVDKQIEASAPTPPPMETEGLGGAPAT